MTDTQNNSSGKWERKCRFRVTIQPSSNEQLFSRQLPDGCLHTCMDYLDMKSWFRLGVVSRFAVEWSQRDSQRDSQVQAAQRCILTRMAKNALPLELGELLGIEEEKDVTKQKEVALEFEDVLEKAGGVWSGGSLAYRLSGLDASVHKEESKQAKAWRDRDLDLFVPWSATSHGEHLCPVAKFFEKHCPPSPVLPHYGQNGAKWRDVCRYLTHADDIKTATLHDSRGAYFIAPEEGGPDAWVPRPVLLEQTSETETKNEAKSKDRELRHWRWAQLAEEHVYRVPFYSCAANLSLSGRQHGHKSAHHYLSIR